MLAMGRLPHQLFPPSRLGTVVTEIAAELPSGWTLTTPLHSGNLWHLYDQISVTTAVTSTGLRIFATLGGSGNAVDICVISSGGVETLHFER